MMQVKMRHFFLVIGVMASICVHSGSARSILGPTCSGVVYCDTYSMQNSTAVSQKATGEVTCECVAFTVFGDASKQHWNREVWNIIASVVGFFVNSLVLFFLLPIMFRAWAVYFEARSADKSSGELQYVFNDVFGSMTSIAPAKKRELSSWAHDLFKSDTSILIGKAMCFTSVSFIAFFEGVFFLFELIFPEHHVDNNPGVTIRWIQYPTAWAILIGATFFTFDQILARLAKLYKSQSNFGDERPYSCTDYTIGCKPRSIILGSMLCSMIFAWISFHTVSLQSSKASVGSHESDITPVAGSFLLLSVWFNYIVCLFVVFERLRTIRSSWFTFSSSPTDVHADPITEEDLRAYRGAIFIIFAVICCMVPVLAIRATKQIEKETFFDNAMSFVLRHILTQTALPTFWLIAMSSGNFNTWERRKGVLVNIVRAEANKIRSSTDTLIMGHPSRGERTASPTTPLLHEDKLQNRVKCAEACKNNCSCFADAFEAPTRWCNSGLRRLCQRLTHRNGAPLFVLSLFTLVVTLLVLMQVRFLCVSSFNVLGVAAILARAMALPLHVCFTATMALVIFPTLTRYAFRITAIETYIPLDSASDLHEYIARLFGIFSIIHIVTHVVSLAAWWDVDQFPVISGNPYEKYFALFANNTSSCNMSQLDSSKKIHQILSSTPVWTGIIMVIAIVVLITISLAKVHMWKSNCFRCTCYKTIRCLGHRWQTKNPRRIMYEWCYCCLLESSTGYAPMWDFVNDMPKLPDDDILEEGTHFCQCCGLLCLNNWNMCSCKSSALATKESETQRSPQEDEESDDEEVFWKRIDDAKEENERCTLQSGDPRAAQDDSMGGECSGLQTDGLLGKKESDDSASDGKGKDVSASTPEHSSPKVPLETGGGSSAGTIKEEDDSASDGKGKDVSASTPEHSSPKVPLETGGASSAGEGIDDRTRMEQGEDGSTARSEKRTNERCCCCFRLRPSMRANYVPAAPAQSTAFFHSMKVCMTWVYVVAYVSHGSAEVLGSPPSAWKVVSFLASLYALEVLVRRCSKIDRIEIPHRFINVITKDKSSAVEKDLFVAIQAMKRREEHNSPLNAEEITIGASKRKGASVTHSVHVDTSGRPHSRDDHGSLKGTAYKMVVDTTVTFYTNAVHDGLVPEWIGERVSAWKGALEKADRTLAPSEARDILTVQDKAIEGNHGLWIPDRLYGSAEEAAESHRIRQFAVSLAPGEFVYLTVKRESNDFVDNWSFTSWVAPGRPFTIARRLYDKDLCVSGFELSLSIPVNDMTVLPPFTHESLRLELYTRIFSAYGRRHTIEPPSLAIEATAVAPTVVSASPTTRFVMLAASGIGFTPMLASILDRIRSRFLPRLFVSKQELLRRDDDDDASVTDLSKRSDKVSRIMASEEEQYCGMWWFTRDEVDIEKFLTKVATEVLVATEVGARNDLRTREDAEHLVTAHWDYAQFRSDEFCDKAPMVVQPPKRALPKIGYDPGLRSFEIGILTSLRNFGSLHGSVSLNTRLRLRYFARELNIALFLFDYNAVRKPVRDADPNQRDDIPHKVGYSLASRLQLRMEGRGARGVRMPFDRADQKLQDKVAAEAYHSLRHAPSTSTMSLSRSRTPPLVSGVEGRGKYHDEMLDEEESEEEGIGDESSGRGGLVESGIGGGGEEETPSKKDSSGDITFPGGGEVERTRIPPHRSFLTRTKSEVWKLPEKEDRLRDPLQNTVVEGDLGRAPHFVAAAGMCAERNVDRGDGKREGGFIYCGTQAFDVDAQAFAKEAETNYPDDIISVRREYFS